MTLQAKVATLSRTAAELFKVYLNRFLRLSGFGIALNLLGFIVLLVALGVKHFFLSFVITALGSAVWLALAHKQALQTCLHNLCQQHMGVVLPYLISKLPWDKLPQAPTSNQADAEPQKQQALQQIQTTLAQIQLPSFLHRVLQRVSQTSLASIVLQAHTEIDLQQGASPANVQKLSAIAAQHIDTEALAPSNELPAYVLAGNCAILLLLLVFG